jgi:adenylosuccinate lyase
MIERYTLPKMGGIWTEENKFKVMCHIEILACEAYARLGKVPRAALAKIKKGARVDIDTIKELEKKTKHDVVAFLAALSENIGPEAQYLHKGLTSNDVIDTTQAVLLKEASRLLLADIRTFALTLQKKAREHKQTLMIGRTHGIHAEPVTFGLKLALFYDEMNRHYRRLSEARDEVCVGKLSGAVGTYANINPFVEEYVCKRLGIKPATSATQVVQRDSHAAFLSALALIGASLEKIAVELRHLQRTEVGEVEEYFSKGQTGSSAMPHKKNPITCERITGLARILRANAMAGLENVALWHERDISHSSVERIILPDSTILLDYMLRTMTDIIKNLVVHQERMLSNIELTHGLIFSQQVLLKLMEKGLPRMEAYAIVQRCALSVYDERKHFKEVLLKNKKVRDYLKAGEVEECFNATYHTKQVNRIFKKVGI